MTTDLDSYEATRKKMQRYAERLIALREITAAISSTLDLPTVLRLLLEKIELFSPRVVTTLRLLNKETGKLDPIVCRNIDENEWKETTRNSGNGLARMVFDQKTLLTVRDVRKDPHPKNPRFSRKHGLVSFLGVPLNARDETIGVLCFYTREKHDFGPEEVEFLTTLANNAAAAIYNSRLYQKANDQALALARAYHTLTQRSAHQAAVAELGLLAMSDVDESALCDRAATVVARTLPAKYAGILELLPKENRLFLRAGIGWRYEIVGTATVEIGANSEAAYSLRSPEPVVVEDLQTETRFTASPLLVEHGVVSGLSVVIQGKERPFGVLGAYTTHDREFTSDDVNFLQSVGNVLAQAISRKRAEHARDQVAAIVESSNDAIVSRTLEGVVTTWNRAAERMFGYSLQEVKGGSLSPLIPPNDCDVVQKNSERLKRGETIDAYEAVRLRKDGSEVPVSISVSPVMDAAGKVIGCSSIYRDITERKWAQEALSRVQAHAQSVLNSMADIYILFDRHWRYVFVNEAAVRSIGRARERILGRTLWELYPDIVDTELERQYRRSMDEAVPIAFDFHYAALDTWWYNRFYPAPEGLTVFATDITERKRAEQELRASREKLRALATHSQSVREQEARRIAHELHDESGQLLASVHITLDETAKELPATAQAGINKAKCLLENIESKLRDISHSLHPTILDDLGLVPALSFLSQQVSKRAGLKIDLEVSTDFRLAPLLEAPLYRFVQEGLNNVAKHAHASRANVLLVRENGHLKCAVSDDGVGFDTVIMRRRSPKNGLGLIGLNERLRPLGGNLDIASAPGKGTTITATLPVKV